MRVLFLLLLLLALPGRGMADERLVRLQVDPVLEATGLIGFIAPRFTLKTRVRIEPVGAAEQADLVLGRSGRPLFEGAGAVWHMEVQSPEHPGTQRFAEWLTGEVGRNTVTSFAPEGTALFGPPPEAAPEVAEVTVSGDAKQGHEVSRRTCTRCHAVDAATRGWGIGSTPSFSVLRGLPDWQERFSAFYILNPHPAFTIIEEVTPPFPENRPSPIAPVELTLDEVEAILAYVASMEAADLGAPLAHQ